MKCISCEHELIWDARFCPQCGQRVEASGEPTSDVKSVTIPPKVEGQTKSDDRARATNLATVGSVGPTVVGSGSDSNEPQELPVVLVGGASLAPPTGPDNTPVVRSGKVLTSPFPSLPELERPEPIRKLSGSAVHTLLAQANLHRIRKEWKQGIECCATVLRSQPANQTAHVVMGDIYRDQKRLDDAVQWYQMAVDLRPNPTDKSKLEQVLAEREREQQEMIRRKQRGYGVAKQPGADMGLNGGTVNLMGVSPRRWLRGITILALGFVALVLVALIYTAYQRNNGMLVAPSVGSTGKSGTNSPLDSNGALPPHHPDKSAPGFTPAQQDRSVVVGGGGIPADRTTGSNTTSPNPNSNPNVGPNPLPSTNGVTGTQLPGSVGASNVPSPTTGPATVDSVRPTPPSNSVNTPLAPQSTRLSGGVQLTQTASDGPNRLTLLLTSLPSLVSGASGEEVLLRDLYRAARNGFVGNSLATQVRVLIQSQPQGQYNGARFASPVLVMEGALDRQSATSTNPETDPLTTLRARIQGYRWIGQSTGTSPATGSSSSGNGGATGTNTGNGVGTGDGNPN